MRDGDLSHSDNPLYDGVIKAPLLSLTWRGNFFEFIMKSQEGKNKLVLIYKQNKKRKCMMRLIIHTYIFHIVGKEFTGILGGSESFPSDIPVPTQCDGSGLCWKFGTFASLTLTPTVGQCYSIEWKTQFDHIKERCSNSQSIFIKNKIENKFKAQIFITKYRIALISDLVIGTVALKYSINRKKYLELTFRHFR